MCYKEGIGVDKSIPKSKKWLSLSASQGYKNAIWELWDFDDNKEMEEKNIELAYKKYCNSSNNNDNSWKKIDKDNFEESIKWYLITKDEDCYDKTVKKTRSGKIY